jgi:hypothetical protein
VYATHGKVAGGELQGSLYRQIFLAEEDKGNVKETRIHLRSEEGGHHATVVLFRWAPFLNAMDGIRGNLGGISFCIQEGGVARAFEQVDPHVTFRYWHNDVIVQDSFQHVLCCLYDQRDLLLLLFGMLGETRNGRRRHQDN